MVNRNRNKRHGKKRHRRNGKPGATYNQDHTQVRGWSQLVEGELIWNSLTLTSIQLVLLTKKVDILMNESCVPFLIA